MSSPALQLDDFGITDLEIHWHAHQIEEDVENTTSQLNIGYRVEGVSDNPLRGRVTLFVKDRRVDDNGTRILDVHVTSVGFFTFDESVSEEERGGALRINGIAILYSSLRGSLLSIAGLFPLGERYILPTISVLSLVQEIEGESSQKNPNEKQQPQT